MDDYLKIQTEFSDFYIKHIKDKLKEFENQRMLKLLFMFLPVVMGVPMLLFVFGTHFYFAVMKAKMYWYLLILIPLFIIFFTAYFNQFFKNKTEIDNKIKSLIFPDINEKLQPVLYISWNKTPVNQKYFSDFVNKHEIMKINPKTFLSDDCFDIHFHDTNIGIYEIENNENTYTAFSGFLTKISQGIIWLIWSLAMGVPLAFLLMFIIRLFPLPDDLAFPVSYILAVSLLYYMLMGKSLDFSFNKGIFDRFKGLIVRFDIRKTVKAHTIIFENDDENTYLKIIKPGNYEKVELEDVEFNKRFTVYSTNQVEARYVLTTAMMDRLMKLKQCFKSKYIRASFKGNELVLGIQADKDLFRLASLWDKTDAKDYQMMFLELISILRITDALNLQDETGL